MLVGSLIGVIVVLVSLVFMLTYRLIDANDSRRRAERNFDDARFDARNAITERDRTNKTLFDLQKAIAVLADHVR